MCIRDSFYLTDGLGPTVMLADHRGRSVATWDYSDYGETTQMSGSATVYNPFLYTGQELDKETGFYHLRARHYAPSLGKFLARDPIGYGGGANLYAYCGGDSINFTDPSGLQPFGERVTNPSWPYNDILKWDPASKAYKKIPHGTKGKPCPPKSDLETLKEMAGEHTLPSWINEENASLVLTGVLLYQIWPSGKFGAAGSGNKKFPRKTPGRQTVNEKLDSQESLHKVRDKWNSEGLPAKVQGTHRTDTNANHGLKQLEGKPVQEVIKALEED